MPLLVLSSDFWLRARRISGLFLLELCIVFAGVYGAYIATEFRQQEEQRQRKIQIYQALIREMKNIAHNTDRVASGLENATTAFHTMAENGEMPPLTPVLSIDTFTPNMWHATIESEGLDLLQVNTIYKISSLYNELDTAFRQLEQLRRLSETLILPNIHQPNSEFYLADNKTLSHKYQWYPDGLANLMQKTRSVHSSATLLIEELTQEVTQLENNS